MEACIKVQNAAEPSNVCPRLSSARTPLREEGKKSELEQGPWVVEMLAWEKLTHKASGVECCQPKRATDALGGELGQGRAVKAC